MSILLALIYSILSQGGCMRKASYIFIGVGLGLSVAFQNCSGPFSSYNGASETATDSSSQSWLEMSTANIGGSSSTTLPVDQWKYPKYAILPLSEAGSSHDSMPQKRRTHIDGKFHNPILFFQTSGLNLYNPNVIKVPDKQYPFRMYFFGWAKEPCNTHLPYHPEHNLNPKKHENWCDSIFLARAQTITGPWQVMEDKGFGHNLQNPERWKPILYSNGRDKVWDYHHTGDPSVVYINGIYFMAYSATGHDIDGYGELNGADTDGDFAAVAGAYSQDGINWVKLDQPLLVSEKEAGFKSAKAPLAERTNVNFHRPTMMYDEGKFKLWFDYWIEGFPAMGYAELSGSPTVSLFSSSQWTIKQGNTKPAIRNWINPTVIKTPEGYFSYSDALLGLSGDTTPWHSRRLHEAYSPDGITWTITGHLPHIPNCLGHAPESILLNNELHLLYHCISEKGENTGRMYLRKRRDLKISEALPKICSPGQKQSCSVANGGGEKTCNSSGTGYGSCTVIRCNTGYENSNNLCIKKTCNSSEGNSYLTTSLTYFSQAQAIPFVSALSKKCYSQTKIALQELQQTDWECTRTDAAVSLVRTCVGEIKQKIAQCQAPEPIRAYLRTAVIYLEGAVTIPTVRGQANACLNNLNNDLPALEGQNWPCPYSETTFNYISTCIEKVIKPKLGQ